MARRPTSRRWLAEHHSDEYVKKARELGYRSRAAFKLEELNQRYALFRPGHTVIDLGAAPGGWSQFAASRIGPSGVIIALDLLPMEPVAGVTVLQGDFRDAETLARLGEALDDRPVDVVMSDMAPNLSGIRGVDVPRSLYLLELALDLARRELKPGGVLVVKAFSGAGFDDFLRDLRSSFSRVSLSKPRASRSRSSETYVVATGYRGTQLA